MNGREFFLKYRKEIYFIEKVYKLLPKFLRGFIYKILPVRNFRILLRYFNLKISSKYVGDNAYVADSVIIKGGENFSIGSNFSLHEFGYIDAAGGIEIGDNVSIAHNCSLISFEHTWQDLDIPIKYNPTKLDAIRIGNDVWLGCGVRVLAGSVIEDRVVVAAGAVVKGTLASGYLYGGIPAKRLKKL